MANWDLEALKASLRQQTEVKDWVVVQDSVRRCERYFLSESGNLATDQDRDSRQLSVSARIFVKLAGKLGRQGEIQKRFIQSRPLEPQVRAAVESALLTDHQAWSLPAKPASPLPELQSFDPAIAEDIHGAMNKLTGKIHQALAQTSGAQFNSSELFVSLHERELHYSTGFVHRAKQTRVYGEAAFSAQGRGISDEYLETRWSVMGDDLPIAEIFTEASKRAQMMLEVKKPATANLAVLVDSEVLLTLFNGHLSQLSGANRYHDLPHLKLGEPLIPSAYGDLITLSLDPSLEGGADTVAVSGDGTPQMKRVLVKENCVVDLMLDQQHAQYLGEKASVCRGSVVVEPGTRSKAELLSAAPRVLEILQFSGLFADEHSGTFSSEIRLAILHDRETGTSTPIKGGSLSGSINENFRGLGLSKEVVKRSHFESGSPAGSGYHGPAWALLSDVSITG